MLGELTRAAHERVRALGGRLAELERAAAERMAADRLLANRSDADRSGGARRPSGFVAELARGTRVAVIAEIKRRSPSKGAINEGIDAPARSALYAAHGARALSVLTEESRFGGSLEDLRAVRAAVVLPILRKDFIVDRTQLLEAYGAGAQAVLLIARALEPARLVDLAAEARLLGLELLVEVRDEEELARAVAIPGAAIGVNTRDLETLRIEPEVGARLVPRVPLGRVAVYESGITTAEDVRRAAALGADAVLVGSCLSASADPGTLLEGLGAVERTARA